MIKKINILFIITFLLILFSGFIKSVFFSHDINEYENRVANKFTLPTIESINNNEFQDNVESSFADQIPFSSYLKKFYLLSSNYCSFKLNQVSYNKNKDKYISFDNLNLYNDMIVYKQSSFDSVKDNIDEKIKNYNLYAKKYPNIKFNFYYIETYSDIDFTTNNKNGVFEYVKKNLKFDNVERFTINNFQEFNKYFYKTDHHWNYQGSYKGYTEISKMLGIDKVLIPSDTKCLNNKFKGSLSKKMAMEEMFNEKFCYYEFDFPKMDSYVDNKVSEYGNVYTNELSYGDFYGRDNGLVNFKNSHGKGNLLVIGNSFDNAIVKLLSSHFKNTYFVDLRYNKDFSFSSFVSSNNINNVLINGSISIFNDEENILMG